MAKDQTIRRRLLLMAGAALLAIGAAAPSGCQPATKPTSTLLGWASHSSVPAPLAEPPCPPGEAWGYPIEGHRQKWGFRIDAEDPMQWLSLRPCLTFASGALTSIGDGTFTIYTSSGNVTGTAAGVRESLGFDIEEGNIELEITGGTKAYRNATGTLFLDTCQRGFQFIYAEIRTTPQQGHCERFIEA